MLTTSADGQCFVVLCGDLYQPESAESGQVILDLYAGRGRDFIKDLHGLFALLLVDRRADEIILATDRDSSFKVFVSWENGTLIASNSLYLHPVQGRPIDRAAVACYLAAGYAYNDRTPYEGVRVLESGSTYHLHDAKLDHVKYWRYQFDATPKSTPLESLKKDLRDLVIEAIRLRLRSDRAPWLSLTGGYDSRVILAVLAKCLRVPDVQCFSYAYGEVLPDSDESYAGRLAALCGYSHQIVPSFDGDVLRVIQRNGHLCGGSADVSDEIDAWFTLGTNVAAGPMPVLFSGDTRFLSFDFDIKNVRDATTGSYMPDFNVLSWTKSLLGAATYREFASAVDNELDIAVKRTPPSDDLYAFRDMLGFEQAHVRLTGPWREYFPGRFFKQARPFLDDSLLELFLRLPTDLRRAKRLYMETFTEMFPELFALPRATSASYASYWRPAIQRQSAELIRLVEGQPSPLDDVIEPDILVALLNTDLTSYTRTYSFTRSALKKSYAWLKRTGLPGLPATRPSLFKKPVAEHRFLSRALTLRSFMAEVAAFD